MNDGNVKKTLAVVISDVKCKEYDKSYVLFTKDFGKIHAYAFGVRKEHSKKIGTLRPFSFIDVELRGTDGRYTISDATLVKSFDSFAKDFDTICYASYFIELVDYFSFENIDSSDIFYLLYYTFNALRSGLIDKKLIKAIFELKILKYQGEYIESNMLNVYSDTVKYAWDHVVNITSNKLYTFNLSDEVLPIFIDEVEKEFKSHVNKKFKSLRMLAC